MDHSDIINRFTYHSPVESRVRTHEAVRRAAMDLASNLNDWLPEGREKSIAITKLEEAVFWANAAIARNQG